MSENHEESGKMERCQHCGAVFPAAHAVHRVVLGRPDRPGEYCVFAKHMKRMVKVGKPKGPGVVGPLPFCPPCADYVDRLLEEEHARLRAGRRWALFAGGLIVVVLTAAALAAALW